MDFNKAKDKKWKNHEDHFLYHYKIALKEIKLLGLLRDNNVVTPLSDKHYKELQTFLNKNLNRYLKLEWITKNIG